MRNDCTAAVFCYHTQALPLTAGVQPLSVPGCCPMHFFGEIVSKGLLLFAFLSGLFAAYIA